MPKNIRSQITNTIKSLRNIKFTTSGKSFATNDKSFTTNNESFATNDESFATNDESFTNKNLVLPPIKTTNSRNSQAWDKFADKHRNSFEKTYHNKAFQNIRPKPPLDKKTKESSFRVRLARRRNAAVKELMSTVQKIIFKLPKLPKIQHSLSFK
uniref:Uncharacterized protein n=1 Tax=Megaviridae environmental sample TaxID=1737588 RepID=A0A5J6VJU8_9VIRU|nr:MAG: hypothetical protein [Megaviridae environmental sample]